jgi:hypothetical protein
MGMVLMGWLVATSYRRLGTLAELRRLAESHLAAGARGCADPAKVADLNETTIELRARLDQPAWVSRRGARAALALGGALMLIQVAGGLGRADVEAWLFPAVSFASGCVAAVACSAIGRAAEQRARQLREEWNALIRRSTQDVPT